MVYHNSHDTGIVLVQPEMERRRFPLVSNRQSSGEEHEVSQMLDQKLEQAIRIMRRAGVQFLAGTDVGPAYKVAGFTLHEELAELNKAGLTPMETIQTVTRNAATFLGKTKT